MRNKTQHGRRKFLKSAAVVGGAATTVALATQANQVETPEPIQTAAPASKGYHTTPHIEEYYRLARD